MDNFISEAKKYYEVNINEVEDKAGEVGIYIFDDYWELLNRRQPRPISTVHLDGLELDVLAYLKNFKSSQNKKRYASLGIPYKKNIMLEGPPGTGKQVNLCYRVRVRL